jgi:hypothetical protein
VEGETNPVRDQVPLMTITGGRLVGVPRFERGASCSQSKRSARLSYTPE